ncbi:hypothetical protein NA57DRAFT_49901 [Rhizodiscina lignyota]|uniref:Uncharacterized protein n=1 Tax=Rhizodiscina lignyota TaxID=1504668 RepID=A0A9P4LZG4_9PEZI|nr:hypothetical protein NA57DRAFT_49901 [Rhizodiscina lignyota]
MKSTTFLGSALLLGANTVLANNPIAGNLFTDNLGLAAAQAAAPMWHMPSGTCMPSAAEDGNGHQTNGVGPDNCNIGKLGHNCPAQPQWLGPQTGYYNIPGEPFGNVPTYYANGFCQSDNTWRIIYYVYFKKDTGHESDWEGVVMKFSNPNGDNNWVRSSVIFEQDGNKPEKSYEDINDTFDGNNDWTQYSNKNRDHPKFYFGKFHHSVHDDWHTSSFKNTCPPNSESDFRNDDYQFWSYWNLRHASVLGSDWVWGKANAPNHIDICNY